MTVLSVDEGCWLIGIERIKNFGMGLKRNQDCFGRRDTARASKAIGQGYLRRTLRCRLNFVFGRNFIFLKQDYLVQGHESQIQFLTSELFVPFCGKVSTGLMQATPGDIKSFKSSAERIALILTT